MTLLRNKLCLAIWLGFSWVQATGCCAFGDEEPPDPRLRSQSPVMMTGRWMPANPATFDFHSLPRIPSRHVVVSDVRAPGSDPNRVEKSRGGVNQHNYLAWFGGRYWIMFSDGPGVEDRVGQRVKYATSIDGLTWSKPEWLTPAPPGSGPDSPHYGTRTDKGFRWIARGFWIPNGELLALASLDEAAGFFGPSLELQAFRWVDGPAKWIPAGVVSRNAINNFPPEPLPNGQWMMSRRRHDYKKTGVHFLIGGVESIDRWNSVPVSGSESRLAAEEPFWWTLPDGSLMALFRDNRRSGRLYRSFSTDGGQNWSEPVRTNFPDATSKMHGVRLSNGRYLLVSNPNPLRRDPLAVSLSDDGMTFPQMGWLVGDRHVDYPHALERDGRLFVAFSGAKQTVEVLVIGVAAMEAALDKAQPRQAAPSQ